MQTLTEYGVTEVERMELHDHRGATGNRLGHLLKDRGLLDDEELRAAIAEHTQANRNLAALYGRACDSVEEFREYISVPREFQS